ncbi:Folylpolyglutamate synthase [Spatholobus suberectus]|nr:Folylpolyglutamate synthase [Spatholobus suberectus]
MEEQFNVLYKYLKMLDLEEAISNMKIIHIAGTKGKEKADDNVQISTFFRFLALLVFKIFATKQLILEQAYVDVLIFQVPTPIVCGITSLRYDHMEILGNTLGEIAGEKAGIFKVPLKVVTPLDAKLLNGLRLGLKMGLIVLKAWKHVLVSLWRLLRGSFNFHLTVIEDEKGGLRDMNKG